MSSRIKKDTIEVYNPSTGEELGTIKKNSLSDLNSIFIKSQNAAKKYNYSNLYFRKKIITRFRKGIIQNLDNLINIICNETGKKRFEAIMEVFISLEHIKESTNFIYESIGKKSRRVGILKTRKAWVEYEPLGVAGIISPWNYPLILTLSPLVDGLLAGNSVILKPSEQTPLTAQLLKKIWDQTTKQNDLFIPVYGTGEIGSAIVDSDKTDVICFTGSTVVGRKIAEKCAKKFKPVILELGGKDPMIILDDADIQRSVDAALWGGLSNAGQTCISVEKIFVHKKIYKEFVEKISFKINRMSSGPDSSSIGPITLNSNYQKINSLIEESKINSQIVQGNSKLGSFIAPTLVIDPPIDSNIMKEEIFGPVITLHPFKTIEDLLSKANHSNYGLSASIFGKNKKKINFIARRLNVGAIAINDVLSYYGITDLPFGGVKYSGVGKVHGKEGIRSFCRQKSYITPRIKLKHELWWFKRNNNFGKLLQKIIPWYY